MLQKCIFCFFNPARLLCPQLMLTGSVEGLPAVILGISSALQVIEPFCPFCPAFGPPRAVSSSGTQELCTLNPYPYTEVIFLSTFPH